MTLYEMLDNYYAITHKSKDHSDRPDGLLTATLEAEWTSSLPRKATLVINGYTSDMLHGTSDPFTRPVGRVEIDRKTNEIITIRPDASVLLKDWDLVKEALGA